MLITTAPISAPPPFSLSMAIADQPSPTDTKSLVSIPDDVPNPAQAKIGPLGQVARGPVGTTSKKKPKGKDPVAPAGYIPSAVALTEPTLSGGLNMVASEPNKPKKNGAGAGKKVTGEGRLPPVVAASA